MSGAREAFPDEAYEGPPAYSNGTSTLGITYFECAVCGGIFWAGARLVVLGRRGLAHEACATKPPRARDPQGDARATLEWLEAVHERLVDAITSPIDAGDDEEGLALLTETEERLDRLRGAPPKKGRKKRG